MERKIVIPLILVLCVGIIAAAWLFEYDKTIEGQVVEGGKKLEVIADLSNFTINISSGNLTNLQNLTLNSKKDDRLTQVFIDVNKTLTEPMCPNYTNDCSVVFGYPNETVINNGDFKVVVKGLNNYTLNTSCIEFSCEQNLTIRVRFVDFP